MEGKSKCQSILKGFGRVEWVDEGELVKMTYGVATDGKKKG